MTPHRRYVDLRCPRCGWAESCGPEAIADRLRAAGMLRRNTDASAEEIRELLRAVAARTECPRCAAAGLSVQEAPDRDQDDGWPGPTRCESCGRAIPPERLELFPQASLCAECQNNEDRGVDTGPAEYCPRCGAVMAVRPSRGSGITRYTLVCPQCRR